MRFISGIFLALVASFAFAADATLTWTPPTNFDDDSPIKETDVITYKVYQDGVMLNSVVSKTTFFVGGYTGSGCFSVTATINGFESVSSPIACKPSSKRPRQPSTLQVK